MRAPRLDDTGDVFQPIQACPGERPAVLDAVRCGFRGVRMVSGTPLGAVRAACEAVRARDGFVSVAAAAFDGADDPEAWVAAARVLRSGVDRPNLLVSVPATPAGIDTVAACLAEGIGVESTLVFSVRQYRAVLDAQGAGASPGTRCRPGGPGHGRLL